MKSLVEFISENLNVSTAEIDKIVEKYLDIVENKLPKEYKQLGPANMQSGSYEDEIDKYVNTEDVAKEKKIIEAFAKANKSERVNQDNVWVNFTIYLPKDKNINAFGFSRQFVQNGEAFMDMMLVYPLERETFKDKNSYLFKNMSSNGDVFIIACPISNEDHFFDYDYKDLRKYFNFYVCPYELGDNFVDLFAKYRK